jgi:hypothetical protein
MSREFFKSPGAFLRAPGLGRVPSCGTSLPHHCDGQRLPRAAASSFRSPAPRRAGRSKTRFAFRGDARHHARLAWRAWLPKLIGPVAAMDLMLAGKAVDAKRGNAVGWWTRRCRCT